MLTVGSLFSGVGGLELGLERTGGFKTVWQVELDEYARRVLEKHWPDVRRWDDVRTWPQPDTQRVDCICGGFPCQPVSYAGLRRGHDDHRWLWPEFLRIIRTLEPRWILGENVPGILSADDGRLFGGILRDLAECGYDAEWSVLSACAMGAPHTRKRVFVVAYPMCSGQQRIFGCESERKTGATCGSSESRDWNGGFRSDLLRVAHGLRGRVDRLRCLGNAVVPQVAEFVGHMILDMEKE